MFLAKRDKSKHFFLFPGMACEIETVGLVPVWKIGMNLGIMTVSAKNKQPKRVQKQSTDCTLIVLLIFYLFKWGFNNLEALQLFKKTMLNIFAYLELLWSIHIYQINNPN